VVVKRCGIGTLKSGYERSCRKWWRIQNLSLSGGDIGGNRFGDIVA
jgi:hypothetical protein